MDDFFLLLFFASIILFFLAFIKPKRFIFWGKVRKRRHSFVYLAVTFFSFIAFGVTTDAGTTNDTTADIANNETKVEQTVKEESTDVKNENTGKQVTPSNDESKTTTAEKSTSSNTSNKKSTASNDNSKEESSSKKKSTTTNESKSNQVEVKLVKTVDGDTIRVNYNGKEETVRYLLIDTPESKDSRSCKQPYAEEAYNRNKQLVNSGKLTLEFEKSKRDKYDRLLAYVFVDGKSVQETLLKEGLARVAYVYEPPYKYLDQYKKAENAAKSEKRNIWGKSGYVTDDGFKGCVESKKSTSSTKKSTTKSNPSKKETSSKDTGSGKESFANCTELRKVYPDGVPKGHPAYQPKMDRDKDNWACER